MKTYLPKVNLDQRKWHVIDANGAVLGRLAAQVANILRGKTAGQDYKNYILSLMFYKRLCDQWEGELLRAPKGP